MNEPLQEPGRKQLPHLPPLEFSNQSVIQYVSCNVVDRRQLLANADIYRLLLEAWRKADHWLVGRHVVMPDHVHFFCAPVRVPVTPLKRWMEFWRAEATRPWPRAGDKPIWQKDFFDRQLRSGESYHQKWLYIVENPVKAGLVACWEDWPYQGELNRFGRTSYTSPKLAKIIRRDELHESPIRWRFQAKWFLGLV